MIQTSGGQALSCDCGKVLCLHHRIIEQFGNLVCEPLILGEEPEAFLIFYTYKISNICSLWPQLQALLYIILPSEPLYFVLVWGNGVVDPVQEQGKDFFTITCNNLL